MTNSEKDNFAVIIPARYKSSRFPGKPLALIQNKPMIQHVWQKSVEAVGIEKVYIATDDENISSVVRGFGGKVIMTSANCLTGTDRIAEANEQYKFDFVINVQGDEPLIKPEHIRQVIESYKSEGMVTNAMCLISSSNEFFSLNIPKVVFDNNNKLIYMSRAGIPASKDGLFKRCYKQVCIYAFSKAHLKFFKENPTKTPLEAIEDIEILRFLESGFHVKMVEVGDGSIAVDIPSDVEKVEAEISKLNE
ncbi:3-deoxy-manno-octulosonate cytidylyltransferase [Paraglaciecola chathamensis]|uniref:3-deoxy-manno-octulosonate cytidylyltransferase n=1 Tax=Paraglaciecola chathamensis S18K6 TaxID=1127672 RepID=A0AAV3V0I1_9ALTE|nr:3-deoxy-manno-octulosonate cytidylyltransferase [Paraglaciecola chathamensis]GAC10549.1 3-deoxy-manno-octulosonate cytidylyltransferase [Paraglaciecola chathamensis S18K6]